MTHHPPLPILRLHLTVRADSPLSLPPYAGSMLRGAFGMSLRKLACITKQKDCTTCPLYRSCPYPQIFETPPPVNDNPLARQTANPGKIDDRPHLIVSPKCGLLLLWHQHLRGTPNSVDEISVVAPDTGSSGRYVDFGSPGRPSTRSAKMFFCTCVVPPPMVRAGANRNP